VRYSEGNLSGKLASRACEMGLTSRLCGEIILAGEVYDDSVEDGRVSFYMAAFAYYAAFQPGVALNYRAIP